MRAGQQSLLHWINTDNLGAVMTKNPPMFRQIVDAAKMAAIRNALEFTSGNVAEAARALGLTERSIWRLCKKYAIAPHEYPSDAQEGP